MCICVTAHSRGANAGHTSGDTERVFKAADTDGSGSLDRYEFRKAMSRLGLGLTLKQVEQVLTVIDADGNGQIDYEEFVDALHKPEPEPEPETIDAAALLSRDLHDSVCAWTWERPWQANQRPPAAWDAPTEGEPAP